MTTYLERSCFDVHLGTQQNTRYANDGEHHSLHGEQAKPDLPGSTAAAASAPVNLQLQGKAGQTPSSITALCSPGPAGVLSGKLEAAVAVNHRIAVQHPPSWPGELYRAAGISQSKDVQHVPS